MNEKVNSTIIWLWQEIEETTDSERNKLMSARPE